MKNRVKAWNKKRNQAKGFQREIQIWPRLVFTLQTKKALGSSCQYISSSVFISPIGNSIELSKRIWLKFDDSAKRRNKQKVAKANRPNTKNGPTDGEHDDSK